ncbi:MAG TPA: thioredoxin [Bacteroidales bacterium]|nr:thioredoxin [Bacteroidales bacterium]
MKKFILLFYIFLLSMVVIQASDIKKETLMIPRLDTIIGYFKLIQLQYPPHNVWYETEYQEYSVDTKTLDEIKTNLLQNTTITIVIGTWCSDSQRETPRFVKILEYLSYDLDNTTAIGVNIKKKAEGLMLEKLNIELVPTFIFYRDGAEIGRIIETPSESLEKDLFKIISTE